MQDLQRPYPERNPRIATSTVIRRRSTRSVRRRNRLLPRSGRRPAPKSARRPARRNPVVLHQQYADPAVCQTAQHLRDDPGLCAVEAADRFVEQQDAGSGGVRSRDFDQPHHAGRQVGGRHVPPLTEPESGQRPVGDRAGSRGRPTYQCAYQRRAMPILGSHEEVFADGQARKDAALLIRGDQTAARARVRGQSADVPSVEQYRPGVRAQGACEAVEERGLAGAVWPDSALISPEDAVSDTSSSASTPPNRWIRWRASSAGPDVIAFPGTQEAPPRPTAEPCPA